MLRLSIYPLNCYIFRMTVAKVRKKYLDFFSDKVRKHVVVPSASLVPENDPTTLFTGSGMQPMLPYLLGEIHPAGRRIADSQKCFRSGDIEEVGDNRHTTFFEMLGNWSLGDYWKEEQLSWVFEFLTKELGMPQEKLWVSCFEGDEKLGLPKDDESADIWKKIGIPKERICFYGSEKNWWSRAGTPENMPMGEPGGADSEIFYDFGEERGLHEKSEWKDEKCHPNCDCGRFMEIGNSVFMEYRKIADTVGVKLLQLQTRRSLTPTTIFEKLPQRNVDFGGGLERITAAVNNEPDIFKLDVFKTAIKNLEAYTEKKYDKEENRKSYRIVLDHIRAAVFLMTDGVMPSNVDRGYFVRRLLRRAILHLDKLKMNGNQLHNPLDTIVQMYKSVYPNLLPRKHEIENALNLEEQQFRKTLATGLRKFDSFVLTRQPNKKGLIGVAWDHAILYGDDAFFLYQTFGFPKEIMQDICLEKGIFFDAEGFQSEFEKHQELSRAGSEKKFKGGLADTSENSVKYHTATHLLHQALRDVLGDEVRQKGSNITPERLRFDFAFSRKMTEEEKERVEDIVNEKIQAKLPMQKVVLPLADAEKTGALRFFGEKYGDEVNVYYIGDSLQTAYSKEFCGGPHVANTEVLGVFKIAKEEAVSAGVRRIKATLIDNS